MTTPKHCQVLILGSGPAGYTAALYAARANLAPVIITGFARGGQLTTTTQVDNWPGDVMGCQGPDLVARMEEQVKRFNTEIIQDEIVSVALQQRPFLLIGDSKTEYTADCLIIATGATAKYLGLPSEQQFLNRGVSACATCDGFFYKNKAVAVIGGGNTAVEEALFLANIASQVTLIHRRAQLRAEKMLVARLFAKAQEDNPRVKIIWDSAVNEIVGTDKGVSGLKIQNLLTQEVQELPVAGVFIAIGHAPNTKIFGEQLTMRDDYLVVGQGRSATATNVPGVFAAGDVADPIYRQAITAAGFGCMAALDAERYLESIKHK